PLIVALKPSEAGAPLHYVVVAGLDQQAGLVLLNDPARRKLLKQDRADFEKQWSGVNKWTLLALPQSDARRKRRPYFSCSPFLRFPSGRSLPSPITPRKSNNSSRKNDGKR